VHTDVMTSEELRTPILSHSDVSFASKFDWYHDIKAKKFRVQWL
jgi:hypothetical protein